MNKIEQLARDAFRITDAEVAFVVKTIPEIYDLSDITDWDLIELIDRTLCSMGG